MTIIFLPSHSSEDNNIKINIMNNTFLQKIKINNLEWLGGDLYNRFTH